MRKKHLYASGPALADGSFTPEGGDMLRSVLSLLALSACGPTVEYMPLANVTPTRRVPAESVAVFLGPPACSYTQLGMIETSPILPRSHNDQLWQMRKVAGEYGADAIIVVDHHEPEHGHHGGGTAGGFNAVAIALGPCNSSPAP